MAKEFTKVIRRSKTDANGMPQPEFVRYQLSQQEKEDGTKVKVKSIDPQELDEQALLAQKAIEKAILDDINEKLAAIQALKSTEI